MSLYKYSQFNLKIATNDNNETYIYNTYSSAGLWIASYDFKEILGNNKIDIGDVPEVLARKGIIVPAEVDEVQRVIDEYTEAINDTSTLFIGIAITMDCNYRCKYCFEHQTLSKDSDMTLEIADAVVDFILRKNEETKSKKISYKYYGGEPLLNINIIQYIANKLRENGVIVNNGMIFTNGKLLTEENIKVLKQSGVHDVRVTIDGLPKTNAILKSCKETDLDEVLDNAEKCKEYIPNTKIAINATEYNKNEILDLLDYIYKTREITMDAYINPVICYTDRTEYNSISEKSFLDIIQSVLEKKGKYSNKVHCGKYIKRICTYCSGHNKNHFIIGPKGYIYRCEQVVNDPRYSIGHISDKSNTITNKEINKIWINNQLLKECLECSVLPMCMGECTADRELRNVNINCNYIINQIQKSIYLNTKNT